QVAQVVLQRLNYFQVTELKHPVAALYDRHLGSERGEHRGVLDADDARADHDHRAGHPLQVDDPVGVDDRLVVEVHAGRAGREGAGRDDDVLRADLADPAPVIDFDLVRADEPGGAANDRDPVTGQLATDDVVFPADDVTGACGQVRDGDLVLDP